MKLHHRIKTLLAALALPLAVNAADATADSIRALLATGDYAAAERAGNVKGALLTDDVRVLRSYARLASAVQTEAAATGKQLGATTAQLDLFDAENTEFKFPNAISWANAKKTNLKRVSRTRVKVSVPAASYVNSGMTSEETWNPFFFLGNLDQELNEYVPDAGLDDFETDILADQPVISFSNTTARTQILRFAPSYDTTGSRRNPYIFINRSLSAFSYNSNPDSGPANRLDYTTLLFSNGSDFDFAGLTRSTYTRDHFIVLAPSDVLTIFPRRNSSQALDVVSLPKGVAIYNGVYPSEILPKLAASANTSDVYTRLANLVKVAVDPTIADLAAVKAGHKIELGGEESISCFPTIIEDADRLAWLGTLKLLKAVSQLPTAYDLSLRIGGTSLFDDSLDLINVLSSNPKLLKLGTMAAAGRTALGTLLSQAITDLESAADKGVAARDPRLDADYLFSAAITQESSVQFSVDPKDKTITVAPSYSWNALRITNSSQNTVELRLNRSEASNATQGYGYLSIRTRKMGSTQDNSNGKLSLYWGADYFGVDSYYEFQADESVSFNGDGSALQISLPPRTILEIGGWEYDEFETSDGSQFAVAGLSLIPEAVPALVTVSVTSLNNNTQSLKDDLAKLRQALTAQGVALSDGDNGILGASAKFSAAPLFGKTPVVIRDRLPQFIRQDGDIKIKPNSSGPLLNQSGLFFNVDIPTWESFISEETF